MAHSVLARLLREVESAGAEARDIRRHLAPLRPLLVKLATMDDYAALSPLFTPLLHFMLLAWKHSAHFRSPARLLTLLRSCCSDLAAQSCRFLGGARLR